MDCKIKYKIISFLLILICGKLHSQDFVLKLSSPEVANFFIYGENQVSFYNGDVNVSIPIYELSDPDFEIPFSINYVSDGFKINQKSGILGNNWSLNIGGCVTREVYGAPDDCSSYNTGEGIPEIGFWHAISKKKITESDLWNLKSFNGYTIVPNISGVYEACDCQPDLFSFKMGGHNASFMIDCNGGVVCSKRGYKIQLNFADQKCASNSFFTADTSNIKITAPDGYQYQFGGTESSLEYTGRLHEASLSVSNNIIMAWHLKKIIAPNGRTVEFEYIEDENTSLYNPAIWELSSVVWKNNTHNILGRKKAILKKINISLSELSIKFNYIVNDNPFYPLVTTRWVQHNRNFYNLDEVIVSSKYGDHYNVKLSYIYESKWNFLKSIQKGDELLKFDYHNLNILPQDKDIQTLYMGNGSSLNDFFGYWHKHTDLAALKTIYYPSGGSTLFDYETHDYSKSVNSLIGTSIEDRNGYFYHLEKITDRQHGTTGGLRICKITNKSNNKVSTKIYKYINEYTPSLDKLKYVSSGILSQLPPYDLINGGTPSFFLYQDWNKRYNIGEKHIAYSSVFEINNDGSYKQFVFSDYIKNPDSFDCNFKSMKGTNLSNRLFVMAERCTSNAGKRGKLLYEGSYDNCGILKREVFSYYSGINNQSSLDDRDNNPDISKPDIDKPPFEEVDNEMPDIGKLSFEEVDNEMPDVGRPDNNLLNNKSIISARGASIINGSSEIIAIAKKIHLREYPIEMLVENDFREGVKVSSKKIFKYNNLGLLSEESTIISKKDTLRKIIKYTNDHADNNNIDIVIKDLLNRNQLNLITEEVKFKNNKAILNTHINYNRFNSLILIGSINNYVSNKEISSQKFLSYNSWGYPLHIETNSKEEFYIWDNTLTPCLLVKNASLNELSFVFKDVLNESIQMFIDINSLSNNIDRILKHEKLSKAHIWGYTKNQLAGITKILSPNVSEINYFYNSNNKLSLMKDSYGNLLKKISYNYSVKINNTLMIE